MPELTNEAKEKDLSEKIPPQPEPQNSEINSETNGEVASEKLPPEEIKEIRESIIEEITKAEQPAPSPEEKPAVVTKPVSQLPPSPPLLKTEDYQKIEKIMEEGLGEAYQSMTADQQKVFKETGEKTASKIEQLLRKAKVKIKEILHLIREWLKIIPGVNKFFLEQEAKIKTDKILKIKNE